MEAQGFYEANGQRVYFDPNLRTPIHDDCLYCTFEELPIGEQKIPPPVTWPYAGEAQHQIVVPGHDTRIAHLDTGRLKSLWRATLGEMFEAAHTDVSYPYHNASALLQTRTGRIDHPIVQIVSFNKGFPEYLRKRLSEPAHDDFVFAEKKTKDYCATAFCPALSKHTGEFGISIKFPEPILLGSHHAGELVRTIEEVSDILAEWWGQSVRFLDALALDFCQKNPPDVRPEYRDPDDPITVVMPLATKVLFSEDGIFLMASPYAERLWANTPVDVWAEEGMTTLNVQPQEMAQWLSGAVGIENFSREPMR